MKRKMMSGAGGYFQGEHVLLECGPELKRQTRSSAFVVGGRHALAAAYADVSGSLEREGISHTVHTFSGFCTAEEISDYARLAQEAGSDCILGIGGGKVMDLAKAVAAELRLPVYTVPTCAATCAAYASLSILYNREGRQESTRYHLDEVNGVFADTHILASAPARYLAAGMADAMAKACEYSSMRRSLHYGDVDIAKYLGYSMARAADQVLLSCGAKAYEDNCAARVTGDLEDAVFAVIAATGIISGMGGFAGRTGSRFAIAHGFNEVMRGRYVDTKQWLHGEIVAVGILAQLYANGVENTQLEQVRSFFRRIGVPVTLKQMGLDFKEADFSHFQDELVQHSHIAPEYAQRVRAAVATVRK